MSVALADDQVTAPPAGAARWRRFGPATLAVAVVAGLLLGYAAGVLTLRPGHPGDTSPEAGFARDMTTHHAQAVAMGMIAYQRAVTPEVRSLGMDIALAQKGQIGTMGQWLRQWGLLPTGTEPPMAWLPDGAEAVVDGLMPGMATPERMTALRQAEGIEVDRLFLELMTTHHLGGIHMAEGILARSDNEDVRRLADFMMAGQQREVALMRTLLAELPAA